MLNNIDNIIWRYNLSFYLYKPSIKTEYENEKENLNIFNVDDAYSTMFSLRAYVML